MSDLIDTLNDDEMKFLIDIVNGRDVDARPKNVDTKNMINLGYIVKQGSGFKVEKNSPMNILKESVTRSFKDFL